MWVVETSCIGSYDFCFNLLYYHYFGLPIRLVRQLSRSINFTLLTHCLYLLFVLYRLCVNVGPMVSFHSHVYCMNCYSFTVLTVFSIVCAFVTYLSINTGEY